MDQISPLEVHMMVDQRRISKKTRVWEVFGPFWVPLGVRSPGKDDNVDSGGGEHDGAVNDSPKSFNQQVNIPFDNEQR